MICVYTQYRTNYILIIIGNVIIHALHVIIISECIVTFVTVVLSKYLICLVFIDRNVFNFRFSRHLTFL